MQEIEKVHMKADKRGYRTKSGETKKNEPMNTSNISETWNPELGICRTNIQLTYFTMKEFATRGVFNYH